MSDAEIAAAVGVTRQGLALWKQHQEFQARIAHHVQTFQEKIVANGIARRQNRVNALNDRWHRMQKVIEERADEHDGAAAGGGTGLLVRQVKLASTGVQVEEFAVDTGLLKEMRETEKQAAQELGQWTEKSDVSSGGQPIRFTIKIAGSDDADSDGE